MTLPILPSAALVMSIPGLWLWIAERGSSAR
jgi:hypothetical protein